MTFTNPHLIPSKTYIYQSHSKYVAQTAQAGNTTSDYDQLKSVWTSLPFGGQLITDTYNRNLVHMLIIPFPVCAYAAIYYEKEDDKY